MNKLIEILNNPHITNNRMANIPIKTKPSVLELKEKLDQFEKDIQEIKKGLKRA